MILIRGMNCIVLGLVYIKHFLLVTLCTDKLILKNVLKITPFQKLRRRIWRKLGNILGEGAYINNSLNLLDADDLDVNIILGNRVATAPGVTFITDSGPNNSIIGKSEKCSRYIRKGTIEVGDDTWIGANVVIQPGIKIGKCCIIGSMSNVTKDIPDYSLAYGNPAKVVRRVEL